MATRISTASIVVGGSACMNSCPFCVSMQTPTQGVSPKADPVNWGLFQAFKRAIRKFEITTVLLTSKGEGLIWPDLVTQYLDEIVDCDVPFNEIQTSGVPIGDNPEKYAKYLKRWSDLNLTTVALSVVHFDNEMNRQIYLPKRDKYPDLVSTIKLIQGMGLTVRLGVMLVRGYIDTYEKVREVIDFARIHGVAQLTFRPITVADIPPIDEEGRRVQEWTARHAPTPEQLADIQSKIHSSASSTFLRSLPHGAKIYDVHGQNVCLTNCLTLKPESDDLRQIIWFPSGIISYDWRYPGARLL